MIPKYDTYNLPLVKTDLVFCKPLKFPPVEMKKLMSQEQSARSEQTGLDVTLQQLTLSGLLLDLPFECPW